jgi:hypothetical protein
MFSFTAKTVGRFFRKPHAPPRAVPQEAPIEEELGRGVGALDGRGIGALDGRGCGRGRNKYWNF